jgi:hypothetical protein
MLGHPSTHPDHVCGETGLEGYVDLSGLERQADLSNAVQCSRSRFAARTKDHPHGNPFDCHTRWRRINTVSLPNLHSNTHKGIEPLPRPAESSVRDVLLIRATSEVPGVGETEDDVEPLSVDVNRSRPRDVEEICCSSTPCSTNAR